MGEGQLEIPLTFKWLSIGDADTFAINYNLLILEFLYISLKLLNTITSYNIRPKVYLKWIMDF